MQIHVDKLGTCNTFLKYNLKNKNCGALNMGKKFLAYVYWWAGLDEDFSLLWSWCTVSASTKDIIGGS